MLFTNICLGFTVQFEGPNTPEEFDQIVGRSGACLESAVIRFAYHKWNNPFRDKLCEMLLAKTGVPIPEDTKKAKVKTQVKDPVTGVITEVEVHPPVSEKVYMDLLKAQKKVTQAELNIMAQQAAKEVGPINLTPSVDSIPKALREKVEGVMASMDTGLLTMDTWINKYESINLPARFPRDADGKPIWTIDNVARAIVINTNRVEAEKAAASDGTGLD